MLKNRNHILATIFLEMSACYKYLGTEHRFRKIANERAASDYIVLTDHSPSSRIAGDRSPKDFYNQFKEIDSINDKIGRRFIKKVSKWISFPTGHLTLTTICLNLSNGLPHRCTADLQVTIPNDSSASVIIH
jgi:hypothetical protein